METRLGFAIVSGASWRGPLFAFRGSCGITASQLDLGRPRLSGRLFDLAAGLSRPEGQTKVVRLAQMLGAYGVAVSLVEKPLLECGARPGGPASTVLGESPRLVGGESTPQSRERIFLLHDGIPDSSIGSPCAPIPQGFFAA
jgi:hypothetical protein